MDTSYEIDKLDRQILSFLLKDSRTSFEEMARHLIVSGGTIHVRVNKLKKMGIIKGSKILIDHEKLGLGVCSFIGINLKQAGDYHRVLEKLKKMPEITEVHYTTGHYSLFVKVLTKSIRDLHLFISEKLQHLIEISSTETFISLDVPVNRDVELL